MHEKDEGGRIILLILDSYAEPKYIKDFVAEYLKSFVLKLFLNIPRITNKIKTSVTTYIEIIACNKILLYVNEVALHKNINKR